MDTTYTIGKAKYRPAPTNKKNKTDWSVMSNDDLKFALDNLSLHHSPFEVDCMNEIERRIVAGTWLQLESPVPTMAPGMPEIFYIFPFSLLWKQRPR